jgi:hypothetical protein
LRYFHKVYFAVVVFHLGTAAWAGAGQWLQDGGSLNENASLNAIVPDLAVLDLTQTLYAGWNEGSNSTAYQAYVKHFNGAGWVRDGSGSINMDATANAYNVKIAVGNGGIYAVWEERSFSAAWNEGGKVFVKKFDGSVWTPVGSGPLNVDAGLNAISPSITIYNGAPGVVWSEGNSYTAYKIYVKRLNGSNWEQLGNSLNVSSDLSASASTSEIGIGNGILYVAWNEWDSGVLKIYVKHYNGSDWVQDGGGVNLTGSADMFSLAVSPTGNPYVAYREGMSGIGVQAFINGTWGQIGHQLNTGIGPSGPTGMVFLNSTPYVVWSEENMGTYYRLYAKHYSGGDWIQDGGVLNVDANQSVNSCNVIACHNMLYAIWSENGQVYVKHYDENYATPTPSPTPSLSSPEIIHRKIEPRLGEKAIIRYGLSHSGRVVIKIYDLLGNLIKICVDSSQDTGIYNFEWKATDETGGVVASGVYIVHIQTPEVTVDKKVIVIK